MYVYHLLILLPAMELEQWEDCSLSLEKKNSDSEDVKFQLQSEQKSTKENGN